MTVDAIALLDELDCANRLIDAQRAHIEAIESDMAALKDDMRIVRYRRNLLDAHIPPGSSVHLIPEVRP